ncbi:unnamed protein product, partial [Porites evermanni]
SGNHHTLDPSIDDGKWFSAKVLKENAKLQANCSLSSLPFVPSTGWRAFPSQNIPLLFNYGHVHYYALESVEDINGREEIEDGLGHMTDKPLKNGRKYVDSGFVHDMMDTVNCERYFVRAHVWPSMRTEFPHNVVVVVSVNSGAVLHASCEPCRASSLGRCSHVVAVLFSVLDYVKKHGPLLAKPCTSEECSWNKGKKRNKNPGRISEAKYSSKKKLATLPVIDFDPRPLKYREVTAIHVNGFLSALQALSKENEGISMWETQLQFTYKDYNLECERVEVLLEKVSALHENLKPESVMEIPGTEQQIRSEKWFSERWCRLTASKCLSAFKVGKLSYWMRYGLESEPKAIEKYESTTNLKVYHSGLWVNPKFPFVGCSPDGLVGNDTVIEIKALKILKQYSVEAVTSPTSPVPKSVLSRQCFKVENGKLILKLSHAYYYQCQQILLVTGRENCDFILHAASGPDSVQRIPRDEPLIEKILSYLTALWMRVIATEIFEMRVPRNPLPFVLPPSGSPDGGLDPEDLTTCTSSTQPDDSMEPVVPFESASPSNVTDPASPAAETTASDLPASSNDSKQ